MAPPLSFLHLKAREAAGDRHSFIVRVLSSQGTFGREPQARPEDDRYLRAAIQEYDNIAKLGQIMREGPIKVSPAGHAEFKCFYVVGDGTTASRVDMSRRDSSDRVCEVNRVLGPCLIQSAVLSGFPAQGGSRRLPEAEKALCSAARHRFHQPGGQVIDHRGGIRKQQVDPSAAALPTSSELFLTSCLHLLTSSASSRFFLIATFCFSFPCALM